MDGLGSSAARCAGRGGSGCRAPRGWAGLAPTKEYCADGVNRQTPVGHSWLLLELGGARDQLGLRCPPQRPHKGRFGGWLKYKEQFLGKQNQEKFASRVLLLEWVWVGFSAGFPFCGAHQAPVSSRTPQPRGRSWGGVSDVAKQHIPEAEPGAGSLGLPPVTHWWQKSPANKLPHWRGEQKDQKPKAVAAW